MMNKEQKKNYIEEMTSKFENSKAVMVTHYQGLTMAQLDELRAQMREHGIIFKITKNRITKLALKETPKKDLEKYFSSSLTGVSFIAILVILLLVILKRIPFSLNSFLKASNSFTLRP